MTNREFKKTIWKYYRAQRREFPWRNTADPYRIAASEIMLQQTQALRVVAKYKTFIKKFPNWAALNKATLRDVLMEWKGLGYNRRAIALKNIARIVIEEYRGRLPKKPEELVRLPGIGVNTAGSIAAFAYNYPAVFIETNVRAVFIHFFFGGHGNVHDKELLPLVEATLDPHSPKEWYYALMDYGAMLKKTTANPSRKSSHYRKQSAFKGSHRELRAFLVARVAEKISIRKHVLAQEAQTTLSKDGIEIERALERLCREGFLTICGNTVTVQ